MRHVLTFLQNHLHVTRSEATFVGVFTTLILLGTAGAKLLPVVANGRLHEHASVETLLMTLDSLGRQDEAIRGVEMPATTSSGHTTQGAAQATAGHTSNASGKPLPSGRININTASSRDLERIPGIGPAMSQRIIERRRQRPFTSHEDLLDVKGIGQKTLEKIRPYISVP
jgi:competence ComEA-like helix-hairpin-helix protein